MVCCNAPTNGAIKGTDVRVNIYPTLFDGLSSDLKPLVDQAAQIILEDPDTRTSTVGKDIEEIRAKIDKLVEAKAKGAKLPANTNDVIAKLLNLKQGYNEVVYPKLDEKGKALFQDLENLIFKKPYTFANMRFDAQMDSMKAIWEKYSDDDLRNAGYGLKTIQERFHNSKLADAIRQMKSN
ncbi:hypothetical protein WR25_26955 [Diploscapter pachys]|uniref:Uncharacterized protein n=1 Tax=Diploscapter pachys TaxID=2018661 RepID=A0A2A2LNK7_9BILA|nr:hypothetical protein WR25_26955 [Diploscapter pachys]